MHRQLRLKQGVGENTVHDLDDVVAVKKVLRRLGHYDTPSYGLTPYPDQVMFDGIKAFQRQQDMTVDGIATPGGATELRLNRVLRQAGAAGLGRRTQKAEANDERTEDVAALKKVIAIRKEEIERIEKRIKEATDPIRKSTLNVLLQTKLNELADLERRLMRATGREI